MGVSIDTGENEGEMALTVQLANPGGASAGKGGKSSKGGESGASKAYINVSGTGKNINYIVREMQHKMSRRIYVAHSQALVMGDALARSGVRDSLDFFARAAEARMTLYVFVSKGKAKDVLDVDPEFEKMPSTEIAKMLKDQKITSHAPIVTEFEFLSAITSATTAAVAPIVSVIEDEGKERLNIAGSAVFSDDTMVGELDDSETRGLLFAKSKVKTGVLLIDTKGETATVEIREASGKVTPRLYSDGTSEFTIKTKVTVGLGDQNGTFNLSEPDNVPIMLDAAGEMIKAEIQSAVDKSKALGADIFGFGEYLNRKYPDQWKQMKKNWHDLYRNVKVQIDVEMKADGNGRIGKPLVPAED